MVFKRFLKDNILIFVYSILAVCLEIIAQIFVSAKPVFTEFGITLLLLMAVDALLLSLHSKKAKRAASLCFLLVQIAIVIGTNILYIGNGTTFQKEMFYQRNDGFGTMEGIFVNIWLILTCALMLMGYVSLIHLDKRIRMTAAEKEHEKELKQKKKALKADRKRVSMREKARVKRQQQAFKYNLKAERKTNSRSDRKAEPKSKKALRIACFAVSIACAAGFCISPIIQGAAEKREENYYYKLTYTANGNQKYGSTTNFLYEMLKLGASSGTEAYDIDAAVKFMYSEPCLTSEYNGVSSGNNLVMIMAESFDTHVLERYTKEENTLVFPNIMKLMGEGIVAENFRQKEKTDTSECISLIGHYPDKTYINVLGGYSENSYPFALPNLFKQNNIDSGVDTQAYSFHANAGSFYNRKTVHKSFGFDEFYSIEDMESYGMINSWDRKLPILKGERSLDSLAMETMKDVMFPTDKSFLTFSTTFTMHGFYEERENLKEQGYYAKLDECGLFPSGEGKEDVWRTYAAAVMDFDKSLGIMMEDLEKKNLLDKTTIVIFSDHNTYYNDLTAYAKNLTNRMDTEGFRLPFIIYDQKLNAAFDANGESRAITKFVTTADIVPTICDLLGIKAWKNMYFGSTMFDKSVESIVFSRIYNYFFDDKVAFYNTNDIQWMSADYTDEHLNDFIKRAYTHLEKLYYLDDIYSSNYFKTHEYIKPA